MGTSERWVGVDRVAAHLGVTKDSVYRWIVAARFYEIPAEAVDQTGKTGSQQSWNGG